MIKSMLKVQIEYLILITSENRAQLQMKICINSWIE